MSIKNKPYFVLPKNNKKLLSELTGQDLLFCKDKHKIPDYVLKNIKDYQQNKNFSEKDKIWRIIDYIEFDDGSSIKKSVLDDESLLDPKTFSICNEICFSNSEAFNNEKKLILENKLTEVRDCNLDRHFEENNLNENNINNIIICDKYNLKKEKVNDFLKRLDDGNLIKSKLKNIIKE